MIYDEESWPCACWRQFGIILYVVLVIVGFTKAGTAARLNAQSHRATISDILAVTRPSSVQISPDGALIAYVVTRASLASNEDEAELYVCHISSCDGVRSLSSAARITKVRWQTDSKTLSYVTDTGKEKQIWRSQFDGKGKQLLVKIVGCGPWWKRVETPLPYEISPDGGTLAYATYDCEQANSDEKAAIRGGVVYDGEFVKPLSYLQYRRLPVDIWILNINSRQTTKLWTMPTFGPLGFTLPEFLWAADSKTLALLYAQPGLRRYTFALINTESHEIHTISKTLGFSHALKRSGDGQQLLFYSEGELTASEKRGLASIYAYGLADHRLNKLSVDQESLRLSYQGASDAAIRLEQHLRQRTGVIVSSCSIDQMVLHAACIQESPMRPPEVVSIALDHGEPIDTPTVLTHLNRRYDSIQLGEISRLTWKSAAGGEGSAGLVLPVGFVAGHRYPILIMLYNLYSGRTFIADAGGFTSYPAQAFAGSGYIILLMNVPRYYLLRPADFATARKVGIDNVVSDIRSAIAIVSKRGIVDSHKMGIMGWSAGCFWTNYIVTHFPNWFQAAASGECAVSYPGQYWLGDDNWRRQEDEFFGGGPYGRFYSRWKQVSPVLNAGRLRIPLLMEYSRLYPAGLEMRTAIIGQGGHVELVIYTDDLHVLQRPLNRYNSMSRHFEWFNFWLRGIEDPNPQKAEEYARWKAMRLPPAMKKSY